MTQPQPPNVLIVMSDQHHPRFMGCAGHPFLHTPRMDRLAGEGTRFQSAYCNSPLCGPSRMSFLTGRYPSEINHLCNHNHRVTDRPTFAHAFGYAGYETILCGRMHLCPPVYHYGFHKWLGGDLIDHSPEGEHHGLRGILGATLSGTTGPHARSITRSGPGTSGYLTYDETMAGLAAQWLRQRGRQADAPPFMMTAGFVCPHAPFVAYPEDFYRYNDLIDIDDLPSPHPESLHPEMRRLQRRALLEDADPVPREDQRRARVAYHGLCTFTDRMLGRILDALEESGLAENTIVVYTSDHGEQLGEHGMWWKHTFYEASVGVPMLMAGPGLPRGHTVTQNVSLMDLPATLLDLCGASGVPGASARSFRCLLDGKETDWTDEVISENLWPQDSDCLHRMIRRGPWKLNHYPGFEPELYNLENDPGELHNLAADRACQQVRCDLEARLFSGWDHDAIMARHRDELAAAPMIRAARSRCDQPEPPTPWFDASHPPENRIDTLPPKAP